MYDLLQNLDVVDDGNGGGGGDGDGLCEYVTCLVWHLVSTPHPLLCPEILSDSLSLSVPTSRSLFSYFDIILCNPSSHMTCCCHGNFFLVVRRRAGMGLASLSLCPILHPSIHPSIQFRQNANCIVMGLG